MDLVLGHCVWETGGLLRVILLWFIFERGLLGMSPKIRMLLKFAPMPRISFLSPSVRTRIVLLFRDCGRLAPGIAVRRSDCGRSREFYSQLLLQQPKTPLSSFLMGRNLDFRYSCQIFMHPSVRTCPSEACTGKGPLRGSRARYSNRQSQCSASQS